MFSRNTAYSQYPPLLQDQLPLRQRRGVMLSVQTSLKSKAYKSPVSIARDLARRMPGQRRNIHVTPQRRAPAAPLLQLESRSKIFTDLSVAYCDFDHSASPFPTVLADPLSNEEAECLRCYTHVIRIMHAKTDAAIGERKVHFDEQHGIHTLSLLVPPPIRKCLPRKITVLTSKQLEAVKDFLCLALPHDSAKFAWDEGDKANVLITAPRWDRGEVDVMSAVLGYLSSISQQNVRMIWEEIKGNNFSIGWEWRAGLDARGVLYVQQAVDKLWERARKEAAEDRVQNASIRTNTQH